MIRDPATIAVGIVLPVMLILLFGFGLSLDVKNVPLAVVVEESSAPAQDLLAALALSPYFRPQVVYSLQAADRLMMAGGVDGILTIPVGLCAALQRRRRAPAARGARHGCESRPHHRVLRRRSDRNMVGATGSG